MAFLMLGSPHRANAQGADLRVLCSNIIKEAVERLRPALERASGHHLAITYGASAELKRAAESGAPFDLALLTTGVVDDLVKSGFVAPGSGTGIAQVNLAVAVGPGGPASDVTTPAGMRKRLLSAKSIVYSRDGGGVAAIERMLERLGIAAELKSRMVQQSPAGHAAESVARGEYELAFAPVSEIVSARAQVLGLFPEEFQSPLPISSGVSAKAQHGDEARALARFLLTPESMSVIVATGMTPLITR
jgi:molybdate transport system substrate-binding protein